MAATVTPSFSGNSFDVWGKRKVYTARITFDSSYPTGGEAVNLKQFGLPGHDACTYIFSQRAPLTGAYNFVYDRTNQKLLVFWADGTAVAAGALPEVANTTDLSALVVDVLIIAP